jgi:choline dehydrogenase-like flavoprotein
VLHANCTAIRLAADGRRVERLELRTLPEGTGEGRTAQVRARAVVLACGGIENARLLLASDDVRPAGVGNDRDMVGRCFMEHPELWKPAVGVLAGDLQWALAFRSGETSPYNIMHLRPSDAMQAREGILNTSLHVTTRLRSDPGAGYEALGRVRHGGWWERARALGSALIDPGDVLDGVYSRFADRQYVPRQVGPTEVMIRVRSEQSPDPDSRVMLGAERDALGMRRVRLDWRMNALDKRTVRVALETFARELGRLRRGRLRIEEWVGADATSWPEALEWGYHHMGTTRMSADPREGVVDADCAVHGVAGLYVAGSSVFPTGGYVNPTLTIVALALRLADHLRAKLA